MKITELIVDNIMKVRAIRIIPKSEVITIQGDNGAGKSSVLDAIVMGFKGKKEFPEVPIRKGAKKGSIKISIDGDDTIPPFTIISTITDKSSTLTIEPDKILSGETPRSFLDKLIGKISFDPLQFINEEGKKQRKVLMELIGIDVDKLDQEEKSVYDERTVKGRDLKAAQGKVDGLKQYPDIKETEEVKVGDLSKKLQEAMVFNQAISNRTKANETLKEVALVIKDMEIPKIEKDIDELEQKLVEAKANLTKLKEELTKWENELVIIRDRYAKERELIAELEPIDVEAINQSISTIESTNIKIRANNTYATESFNLQSIQKAYDQIDNRLEGIRTNRLNLIQSANIPVEGLTFDEDGLLYHDIPLSQCSDGEKLMVSMGISMALNPTMRVVRIKDGSLLGGKNRVILEQMCKDKDFQCWLECVSDRNQYEKNGKIGILIEEGQAEGAEVIEDVPEPTIPIPEPPKKKDKAISNVEAKPVDDPW
jgi:predicted ATP-binding protein involved in virulence